jgi:hypothetical protein
VLIAYCTGLIIVCTVLLVVATTVTIKNYWLLRDLAEGSPPGRHERAPSKERPLVERSPVERRPAEPRHVEPRPVEPRPVEPRQAVAYYDSHDGDDRESMGTGEWTGPVVPYTPAYRGGRGPE